MTKSQILAALQKTNKLLDEHHRGEMYANDDCPVCIHVKAMRKLIRENSNKEQAQCKTNPPTNAA